MCQQFSFQFRTVFLCLVNRCTLLEPGPVKTSVMGNMEAWMKKYDMPTADQESLELQKAFNDGPFLQGMLANRQDVNEFAVKVKNIILTDKPNPRCQTHENFNPDEIKAKLADPTGNVMVDLMVKKYFVKE